ncbi:MAG: TerB family tellurite resistance protein [Gammaproteobacteria bacterium]|nr:TerB family tellurite resistance protein [Gammaproteobacteria bacterium]
MKALIQQFFKPTFERFNKEEPELAIDLATAILMIEVSRADFNHDPTEAEQIRQLLLDHLSLCEEEVDTLIKNAHREADNLVSLQHITRLMNEQMDQRGKVQVIELMWKVAYADGDKHHYEEHLLRQVAELLYVSHADFIQARHQAE